MTVLRKKLLTGTVAAILASTPAMALASNSTSGSSDDAITVEQVQKKLNKTFNSIADYSAEQRDEAIASTREALNEIDEEIEALEARTRENWAEMKVETREQTAAALSEVRSQRNALAEKFGALQQSSDSAWEEIKDGFAQAWRDLKTAWQDADEGTRSN
ncbi:hypothetical protein [Sneathiella glossodoripedis]|uniref:hypothetical protein n=1 Tax=Sneathiella glossodoripedis TaxID=418853 RepID=UPI0004708B70|nr:hypothetical protein [Sneathiella glossodoripedis]